MVKKRTEKMENKVNTEAKEILGNFKPENNTTYPNLTHVFGDLCASESEGSMLQI